MSDQKAEKKARSPKVQAWLDDTTPMIRVRNLSTGIRCIPVGDKTNALVAPGQIATVPQNFVRRFCETRNAGEWAIVEPKSWPFDTKRKSESVDAFERPGALQVATLKQAAEKTQAVPRA